MTMLEEKIKEQIVAFVDGNLPEEEIAPLQQTLAENPAARGFLEQLSKSDMPFKQAFSAMLDQPVPENVTNLVRNTTLTHSSKDSDKWRGNIAAAVLVGILVGGGVTYLTGKQESGTTGSGWVDQVANYQSLYIRSTVANAVKVEQSDLDAMILVGIGQKLSVPDLSSEGIEFKRGQMLQVDGNPLLQLAYLPASGIPLALCVMRDASAKGSTAGAPSFGSSHGMGYGSWHSNGLRFVLVADQPIDEVRTITELAISQISPG